MRIRLPDPWMLASVVVLAVAVLLAACTNTKRALDYTSGSSCLAQREVAVNLLLSYLDNNIGDNKDSTVEATNSYAIIKAEDIKPDDLEDQTVLDVEEARLNALVFSRIVDYGYVLYGSDLSVSKAELYGMVVAHFLSNTAEYNQWRVQVRATSC
jgi:hypothetical protein